ncbi:hypothetical protein F4556_005168 [Kitasatospora gansuensis]|uniref:Uncharacterized protein n=1 Tax=Kitasatospora gansuensis TaxID=258050 RepID=A0A7W7WJX5_9ACTN|nr:hypothetical protein [Kitasatospora gansuensis]MBB4949633.1 hypothetical protein [Kitasatospora gansuensis]
MNRPPPAPFSGSLLPAYEPGDARESPARPVSGPDPRRDRTAFTPVWLRAGGQWRTGLLLYWRQYQDDPQWQVTIQFGDVPGYESGWYQYDPAAVVPVPVPEDSPAADTVLTDRPEPGTGRTVRTGWRLLWVRRVGRWIGVRQLAWHQLLGGPWIAEVQATSEVLTGEYRARSHYVVYDPVTVRPVPDHPDTAALTDTATGRAQ